MSSFHDVCSHFWEIGRGDPTVDIRLLFTRQFGACFLVMMAVGAVMFSTTQIMPQLQQTALAYTATLSGLSIMPGGIAMLRVCGWLRSPYGI
ncbi:hypothetical protein [Mesorhizobium sp. M0977]|uniref:hypothetical protein n=1 Tax=Mesorhizobium sp. M0977 TaxID=2957039 RepID=UPI00333CD2AA